MMNHHQHCLLSLQSTDAWNATTWSARPLQTLTEWHAEEDASLRQPYPVANMPSEPVDQLLVLELPRYFWSILGRTLLLTCKEGSAAYHHPGGGNSGTTTLAAAQNKGTLCKISSSCSSCRVDIFTECSGSIVAAARCWSCRWQSW